MSLQTLMDLLDEIALKVEIARIEAAGLPPPQSSVTIIKTAPELDRALAVATEGTTLLLDSSLSYPMPLKLPQVSLTLESTAAPSGRMDKDVTQAPRFDRGIAVLGNGIHLVGLDIRNSALTDIVTIAGANCALDRCRILGDPVKGSKRGVAANSDGNCQITGCYIDDCFGPYPGQDTQAICAWDMGPGLLIENCYLSGGSETILIGGADPQNALRNPSKITIRGCTITKNPAWQAQLVGVKNTLELKNARTVLIEDNDISQSWGGHGQDGYLLALAVRNQGGADPTATIQDVLIQDNRFSHGGAAITILGRDNNYPSEPMARVTIAKNAFTDVTRTTYLGSNKLILIDGGPSDLALTDNTFESTGHTSTIYFAGPRLERFTFTGNRYPRTKYGIFGMNTNVNQAFTTYVASGVTAPNTEI